MSEHNPWKTVGTKQAFKNPWFSVRVDDVVTPKGTPGTYSVVELRGYSAVIALTEQDEVIMVGQYRYPTKMYSWEIVEGGRDEGEDYLSCAKRELREETGYEAEQWEQLGGEFHTSNCITNEVGKIFVAKGLTLQQSTPEDTEVLTVRKIPFDKVLSMVFAGEVVDSSTVAGILQLAFKRQSK